MAENRYKIVFNAAAIPANEIAGVKSKLSVLLNIEGRKREQLFSARPVVIRSDVDRQTALRYKSAFERAGVSCQLVEIRQKAIEDLMIQPDIRETVEQPKIICPGCDFEQNKSEECIRCGVIISKYRKKKPQESPPGKEAFHNKKSETESCNLILTGEFSGKNITGFKWILNKVVPKKFEYFFRNIFQNIFTRKNPYYNYGAKVLDILIQAVLLIIITFILYTLVLYLCKISWNVYVETHIGEKYLQMYPATSQSIFDLLNRNLIQFSMQMTSAAFSICLVISALCQVFHIARYFYLPRGFFGKILLWGLPLAAVVAFRIRPVFGFHPFGFAYVVSIVPALCVFSGCFHFTYELLPEIGDLLHMVLNLKAAIARKTHPDKKRRVN